MNAVNAVNASRYEEVRELAEKLVEQIEKADIVAGFDNDGTGPYQAMKDDHFLGGDGPIRKKAKQLKQALRSVDRLIAVGGSR